MADQAIQAIRSIPRTYEFMGKCASIDRLVDSPKFQEQLIDGSAGYPNSSATPAYRSAVKTYLHATAHAVRASEIAHAFALAHPNDLADRLRLNRMVGEIDASRDGMWAALSLTQ